MKNGVSDVCLPLARGIYHGFYIEMKYGKNKLTDEQFLFLKGVKSKGMQQLCVILPKKQSGN